MTDTSKLLKEKNLEVNNGLSELMTSISDVDNLLLLLVNSQSSNENQSVRQLVDLIRNNLKNNIEVKCNKIVKINNDMCVVFDKLDAVVEKPKRTRQTNKKQVSRNKKQSSKKESLVNVDNVVDDTTKESNVVALEA